MVEKLSEMSVAQMTALTDAYPWFAPARAALCVRVARESGMDTAEGIFRDSLLFFPDGGFVAGKMEECAVRDYTDADLAAMIRDVVSRQPRFVIAGADYFSVSDYDSVRKDSDASISGIARVDYSPDNAAKPSPARPSDSPDDFSDSVFLTETLARIYEEQGYPDKAEEIYYKLSLRNPEKNAYFARLIQNLQKVENIKK